MIDIVPWGGEISAVSVDVSGDSQGATRAAPHGSEMCLGNNVEA